MNESWHTSRFDCTAPAGPCPVVTCRTWVSVTHQCRMLVGCTYESFMNLSLCTLSCISYWNVHIYQRILSFDVWRDVWRVHTWMQFIRLFLHVSTLFRHIHTPAVQLHQGLQHVYILTIFWNVHPQMHCINFFLYIQALWRHVYIPALQFHQGLPHRYILAIFWHVHNYGVASTRRLLKIISLFCKRAL